MSGLSVHSVRLPSEMVFPTGINLLIACLVFVSAAYGWESNTQYAYEYNGRVATGIEDLKQQWGMAHISGLVSVQTRSEGSLIVKFTNGRIQHISDYEGSTFDQEYAEDSAKGIGTKWEPIEDMEPLERPFIINHKMGSVTDIQTSADEPLWTVNIKKAIASQLQVDVGGIRSTEEVKSDYSSTEESNIASNIYEDGVSGSCSTWYQINRLPESHPISWNQWNADSPSWFTYEKFEPICKDSFWEITKIKDFNKCLSNPILNWVNPSLIACDLGTSGCSETMQRTSHSKYVACGKGPSDWTIIRVEALSDFVVQPFAIRTEKLNSRAMMWLTLKSKEAITSPIAPPPNTKTWSELAYTFPQVGDVFSEDKSKIMPDLTSAYMPSKVDKSVLMKNVVEMLRVVAQELKQSTESKLDLPERMINVRHALLHLSVDELRTLEQQIKSDDPVARKLFIDAVVTAGTNPTVILIKEMIEKGEISTDKAIWIIPSLTYHVKTPTRELLSQLVEMIKSRPVQSNKDLKKTALLNVAELMSAACIPAFQTAKRFPTTLMGDFCTEDDSVITQEFLPLLTEYLKESEDKAADLMVALTALGNLGHPDIIPILVPHIRGSETESDPAQRTRAVLALHRVMYSNPERVTRVSVLLGWKPSHVVFGTLYNVLTSLADNISERSEVRMAAIGLLLNVNTPMAIWQKIAYRTWFDKSQQVAAFTHSLISSLASIQHDVYHESLTYKARGVLPIVKPWTSGYSWSGSAIHTKFTEEGSGVFSHYPSWFHSSNNYPVAVGLRRVSKFGPMLINPVQIFIWNYNMEELYGKLYQQWTGEKPDLPITRGNRAAPAGPQLSELFEQLKPTTKPEDKRTAILHANLMGSMHKMVDIEELIEMAPQYLDELMTGADTPVSWLKFGNLVNFDLEFPNELGLTTHFVVHVPVLASVQGSFKLDKSTRSVETNAVARFNMKLTSKVRTAFPWNTKYIGSGVDVRLDLHAPRRINVKLSKNGEFEVKLSLSEKVNDIMHFHVMPYTISREWSTIPTLEDQANVRLVRTTESPFKNDVALPPFLDNFKISMETDYPFNDLNSWASHMSKFDLISWMYQFMVPLRLHQREYRIKYLPEAGKMSSISTMLHYFSFWRSGSKSITYTSGTANGDNKPIESSQDIPENAKEIVERLFKSIDNGVANIIHSAVKFDQKDGTTVQIESSYGYAQDHMTSKSYRDLRWVHSNSGTGVNYSVCGSSSIAQSQPPSFGFSSEPLYQTEDGIIQMGNKCESGDKLSYKVKLIRDEMAAKVARETDAAQKCRLQMKSGLIDSPSCQEARQLDQTFNIYQLDVDVPKLPEKFTMYTTPVISMLAKYMAPFIVSHASKTAENNKWTLKASRQPISGHVDVILRSPTSVTYARNVHFSNATWSPAVATVAPAFFPIQVDTSYVDRVKSSATGGVSESRCFVGEKRVITYDSVAYNYTLGECDHVLVTDCSQKSNFAVLARDSNGRKIVTVVLHKDVVEVDPSGSVTINGESKSLDKDTRFEIFDGKDIIVSVFRIGNVMNMELSRIGLELAVNNAQVTITGPWMLRGRTCGICGDFDQEKFHEHKTPQRCSVSSGSIMATSYQVRKECKDVRKELVEQLAKETEKCFSVDQHVRSDLPIPDLSKPTKCNKYETYAIQVQADKYSCESTSKILRCQPGCSPAYVIHKPVDFKCSGDGATSIFRIPVHVATSCI